MAHAYVTYFDKNYLVKGLAMLDSLERHDPGRTAHVVCLDEETFRLLVRLERPGVRPVPLSAIERGDEALAAARANRSRVEYYWTMTPTILFRLLEQSEPEAVLSYIDADLYFFSSVQPIFDELGSQSVLIHKHNFPPRYAAAAINGIYNVGLLCFRNDAEGRNVLGWWRERCLEWCYDRCEDGKMGDQKYLESFASLTDRLVVSDNPGVGVAPWNFSGYRLGDNSEVPTVNGMPTVFFHYHSAAYVAPGCLAPVTDLTYLCTQDMLRVYAAPYLDALDAALNSVRAVAPGFAHGFRTEGLTTDMCMVIRTEHTDAFRDDFPCIMPLDDIHSLCSGPQLAGHDKLCGPTIQAGKLSWTGNYPDWQSAVQAAGGYDDQEIFLKVREAARAVRDGKALWERDSMLFDSPEVNWPLLAGLMSVAARAGGKLHVLDFGGALGSTYMQHRDALKGLAACTWHVVEQGHFVRCGQEEFTSDTLFFHATTEEAFQAAPINVILFSGVLQYLETPYALLKRMTATRLPIILDRTPVLENGDRITVQHVPAEIYRASYPCRWLDKRRLTGILQGAGYELSPWFLSSVDPSGFGGVLAINSVPPRAHLLTPTPHADSDSTRLEENQPLRIMQVDDFYPAYLDAFYKSRPGLSLKSSAEQSKALLQDGFSAIHAVVPYLPDDNCRMEYFVSAAQPLQRAWAREQGMPFPYHSPSWEEDIVRARVAAFRPDVLYLADPLRFDARFLRTLPYRPRLILGWKAADVPFGTDWTGYDVILSGLPRLLELAKSLGAKAGVLFAPGMPAWIADAVVNIPQETDVCFVGSIAPGQHTKRVALLDTVAKAATERHFSLALHLNCHPSLITPAMRPHVRQPVFGLAMHQALRRARIILDDRAHHGIIMPDGSKNIDLGGEDTINMRMFEATGGGSLLLTESLAGLRRYFEPDSEVAVYQHAEDAVRSIQYFLSHADQRMAMAQAGKTRCLKDWNMERSARSFLRLVREHLALV